MEEFASQARAGVLTAEELLGRYVTIVYSRTGSYEETARRLGLDRRTVKAKVDWGVAGEASRKVDDSVSELRSDGRLAIGRGLTTRPTSEYASALGLTGQRLSYWGL